GARPGAQPGEPGAPPGRGPRHRRAAGGGAGPPAARLVRPRRVGRPAVRGRRRGDADAAVAPRRTGPRTGGRRRPGRRPDAGPDPAAVTAVVAALAGFFVYESLQPALPGLPTLRDFQAAQGRTALDWLSTRVGWSPRS